MRSLKITSESEVVSDTSEFPAVWLADGRKAKSSRVLLHELRSSLRKRRSSRQLFKNPDGSIHAVRGGIASTQEPVVPTASALKERACSLRVLD